MTNARHILAALEALASEQCASQHGNGNCERSNQGRHDYETWTDRADRQELWSMHTTIPGTDVPVLYLYYCSINGCGSYGYRWLPADATVTLVDEHIEEMWAERDTALTEAKAAWQALVDAARARHEDLVDKTTPSGNAPTLAVEPYLVGPELDAKGPEVFGLGMPPANAAWSGDAGLPVPPAIGTRVDVVMNGLGEGLVTGYFFSKGYVGIEVVLEVSPEWRTRQLAKAGLPARRPATVFGTEVRAIKTEVVA